MVGYDPNYEKNNPYLQRLKREEENVKFADFILFLFCCFVCGVIMVLSPIVYLVLVLRC